MPKVDFTNKIDEFDKWLLQLTDPTKYIVYATDDNELILRPTKSTPTYDYATIAFMTNEAMGKIALKLEERGYFVSRPTAFSFNMEMKVF